MTLTSKVAIALNGKLTTTPDLTKLAGDVSLERASSFLNGTLAGQADRVWVDINTIAASGTVDIDLAGSLTDPTGAAVTFARVKGLVISAASANTNNVVVGAATSNPWTALLGTTHTLQLRPGAAICLMAGMADLTGYAVVAGTGDILRLANSGAGTSVAYDIAVIGCSA